MKRILSGTLFVLCSLNLHAASPAEANYAARPEVQEFIAEVSKRNDFDMAVLRSLFEQARPQSSAIKAMTPLPQGQRSWRTYRANFINARRIEAGLRFKQDNEALLQRAETEYGVPRDIIVAIIGVETEYGRNMGTYRVLDVLSTLTFDYPRRAEYFRSELEEFLLLSRESKVNAAEFKGSYAGAIGVPQFMPSSIRRYGVDFDGDDRRDLRGSVADAIGSVGNFLQKHGWVAGAAISADASVEGEAFRAVIDGGVATNRSAEELRRAGVKFDPCIADDVPGVLIELESPNAPAEYRVGLQNFYVLTRYNRSSFYASAVSDLAAALSPSTPTDTPPRP